MHIFSATFLRKNLFTVEAVTFLRKIIFTEVKPHSILLFLVYDKYMFAVMFLLLYISCMTILVGDYLYLILFQKNGLITEFDCC